MSGRSLLDMIQAYDCVALVLQGGGALGAYQAGVFEALADHGIEPRWLAGVSIGAINAALIAGNPPERRRDALRGFWQTISSPAFWGPMERFVAQFMAEGDGRVALNQLSATKTLLIGQPGFFAPRLLSPFLAPPGTAEATSFYDTTPLRATLERFVDFARINGGKTRLSLGAANVRTGNSVYFDTARQRIGPEHVMASGALPPGFPAIEIEGEHYWDGGVVSNTPLQYVLDENRQRAMLVFQVDLWSARGELPRDIISVMERRKDITYSSRTRLNTDVAAYQQKLCNNIATLLEKLPAELRDAPEVAALREAARPALVNIIHLIYRRKNYEGDNRDYEFSELTMREHWRSGREDTAATLRHQDWLALPPHATGTVTHDLWRKP
ncbi:MAG TPA: patatin-like phospholipase family protein [Stellaceae bacterium]|nr:patatin-like phospholipase family protein [Stellaceae bacterium]